jgi:hypothetical protein
MKNKGWTGKTWYCPSCGHELKSNDKTYDEAIEELDPNLSFEEYDAAHKTILDNCWSNNQSQVFFCTNEQNCQFGKLKIELNLFHPIYGIKEKAGDSWAIGFIK